MASTRLLLTWFFPSAQNIFDGILDSFCDSHGGNSEANGAKVACQLNGPV